MHTKVREGYQGGEDVQGGGAGGISQWLSYLGGEVLGREGPTLQENTTKHFKSLTGLPTVTIILLIMNIINAVQCCVVFVFAIRQLQNTFRLSGAARR